MRCNLDKTKTRMCSFYSEDSVQAQFRSGHLHTHGLIRSILVIVFLVTNTLIYNDCLYIYIEDTNADLSVCLSPRSFSTIARSYRDSILTELESLVVVLLY